MATAKKQTRTKTPKTTEDPVTIRSQVTGQAVLSVRLVDRRYTIQKVVDGLNSRELTYSAGQIHRAGHVIARYHLQDVDDHLENFRLGA
jgi:hypothetical protein